MKTLQQLEQELAMKEALEKERDNNSKKFSNKWVETKFAIPIITLICTAVFGAIIYLVINKS